MILPKGGLLIILQIQIEGKKLLVSLEPECQSGGQARDLRLSGQAALTTLIGDGLHMATMHPPPPTHPNKTKFFWGHVIY